MQHLWVHARRDFIRAAQRPPELRAWSERWLKRFADLYALNARRLSHFDRAAVMSAQPAAFDTAQRRLARNIAELFESAERELRRLPEGSPKSAPLRALIREREGLTVFLDEPGTPMDNNASERVLRAPANSRKVSFGSHSEPGARLGAVLFSLFATLALAGINRHHWLPWTVDKTRLERMRHPYPVQPHGP